MKFIKATSLTPFHEHSSHPIIIGSKIKLYGKETTVTGFYGAYNEGLEKWETIILTEGRGDPFERSVDQIEIDIDSDDSILSASQSPCPDLEREKAKASISHARAIGLINGVVKGIETIGKEVNLDGIKKSLNEAVELIKGDNKQQ